VTSRPVRCVCWGGGVGAFVAVCNVIGAINVVVEAGLKLAQQRSAAHDDGANRIKHMASRRLAPSQQSLMLASLPLNGWLLLPYIVSILAFSSS
jgi:hypothetical protein